MVEIGKEKEGFQVCQLLLSDDVRTDGVQVLGAPFLHGPQGIAEQSSACPKRQLK